MTISVKAIQKAKDAFNALNQRAQEQRFNQITANDALIERLAASSLKAQTEAQDLYQIGVS